MKCPDCGHISDTALLRCNSCGEAFTRDELETLEHLDFLLAWLDERATSLGMAMYNRLRSEAVSQHEALRKSLDLAPHLAPTEEIPAVVPEIAVAPEEARQIRFLGAVMNRLQDWVASGALSVETSLALHDHLSEQAATLRAQLPDPYMVFDEPEEHLILSFAIKQLPLWKKELNFARKEGQRLFDMLYKKRADLPLPAVEAPTPRDVLEADEVAIVKPISEAVVIPEPAPRPAFKLPKLEWAKWWERAWGLVVSGALLRGLLYLGAFMIVVSAAVLVIRYWDVFPPMLQLLFIAAVPTVFFLAGWLVRTRLKLPVAGGVLTDVGALLVAVDFAAVYQFGGLAGRVDLTVYWLGASLVCTLIYALGARQLKTEFFGYITLLGGMSALLAFTRLLRLPLEWQIVAVSASAPAMVEGAARLDKIADPWDRLACAARRMAQLVLPISIALVLFVPGRVALGQTATFVFASLGFGLLAWRFPKVLYAHAAVWTSIGAFAFIFRLIRLPYAWYATTIGALSILYLLVRQGASRRWPEESEWGENILLATRYAQWALLGITVLTGFVSIFADRWAGVFALALSSLVLGWNAYIDDRPSLVLLSGGLFIVPFSLALDRLFFDFEVLQSGAWLMVGWVGLALVYLALASAMRKAEQYVLGLNQWAHALTPAALVGLIVNYSVTWESWFNGPTLVALGGMVVVYTVSSLIQDRDRLPGISNYLAKLPEWLETTIFLWPVGILVPLWLSVAWMGSVFKPTWLGTALAALGLVYVGLGEVLRRRKAEYRLPAHVLAYVLAVSGILVAFGERWALLTTLYLVVAIFAALAVLYRRVYETAVTVMLFVWPFQLSLELSPVTAHAYSLAYALLASLVYIPIALRLDRLRRRLALPAYICGYAMAVFAVGASLLGRFGVYELDVPWVGAVTPLIASGLFVLSAHWFKLAPFGWAAAVTFPIAFGQALTLFRVPQVYVPVSWVGLAYAYMLIERTLGRRSEVQATAWYEIFRWPLRLGNIILGGLGLALTSAGTATAFSGIRLADPLPLILAQVLAVCLAALAAHLYRNRWPMFAAAVLIFFPTTWSWIRYGPDLTQAQYALVWMGLSAVLLGAGFALDKARVRFAHGPYLVGYVLCCFALVWSVQDQLVNLYALAAFLILAVLSQVAVHARRHRSFDDFVKFVWRQADTVAQRVANNAFLFVAVFGLPVWLTQLLSYHEVTIALRGLALALVAPLYVALGMALKRVRLDYSWPFYVAGYALTGIGAMLAFEDQVMGIAVLILNTVVYAASSYIFRQAFWLYLSNALVPVVALLSLHYRKVLVAPWIAGVFMGLAYLYVVVGWLFNRRTRGEQEGIASFALPFFSIGYLLSAIALSAAGGERYLAIAVFASGVVLYSFSSWALRESLFLYPAAWLLAVPYYLVMTLTPLSPAWYGLGWLPLILVYLLLGRFVFQRVPLGITSLRTFVRAFANPAMPFYTLAYALSVSMMALSRDDPLALTFSFVACAVIAFASAALFRQFAWQYPGLLTTHLAIMAAFSFAPEPIPTHYITLIFSGLTWALALIGVAFVRRIRPFPETKVNPVVIKIRRWQVQFGDWPFLRYLLKPSWAQPFFLFVALDLVVWQLVALYGIDSAILVATSNAILLGLFAMLWEDAALASGSLAFFLLAAGYRLGWTGLPLADGLAWMAGIGFGMYLLALTSEHVLAVVQPRVRGFSVWLKPLVTFSVILTAVAVLGTLPMLRIHGLATVVSLVFAGMLYLTIAYRRRRIRLSYLGLAMLQIAWILILFDQGVQQLQGYVIPAGLYFAFVGHLERRSGRLRFGTLLEAFGLTVILVSSFTQSLDGAEGFPYFLLLLVEGLLTIWWGAANRRKVPFFMGLGASALNVVAQVIVLVNLYDVQRWIIFLGVGVLLVSAAVFVERRREQIVARAQQWLEMLETWE